MDGDLNLNQTPIGYDATKYYYACTREELINVISIVDYETYPASAEVAMAKWALGWSLEFPEGTSEEVIDTAYLNAAQGQYWRLTQAGVEAYYELQNRPSKESVLAQITAYSAFKQTDGVFVDTLISVASGNVSQAWLSTTAQAMAEYNSYAMMVMLGTYPEEGVEVISMADAAYILDGSTARVLTSKINSLRNEIKAYARTKTAEVEAAEEYWVVDIEAGWPLTYSDK